MRPFAEQCLTHDTGFASLTSPCIFVVAFLTDMSCPCDATKTRSLTYFTRFRSLRRFESSDDSEEEAAQNKPLPHVCVILGIFYNITRNEGKENMKKRKKKDRQHLPYPPQTKKNKKTNSQVQSCQNVQKRIEIKFIHDFTLFFDK